MTFAEQSETFPAHARQRLVQHVSYFHAHGRADLCTFWALHHALLLLSYCDEASVQRQPWVLNESPVTSLYWRHLDASVTVFYSSTTEGVCTVSCKREAAAGYSNAKVTPHVPLVHGELPQLVLAHLFPQRG